MKSNPQLNSVYLNSLRETYLILATWVIFAAWVIGYSMSYGYNNSPETFSTVGGIPEWIFWGIGLPWVLAVVVTIGFAVFIVKDDPLDESDKTTGVKSKVK